MKVDMKKDKSHFLDLDVGDVFIKSDIVYMKTHVAELYNMNHINAVNLESGMLEYFDAGKSILYCENAVVKA